MKKRILFFLSLILLISFVLGIIDYCRIKNNKMPIFMVKITDSKYSKLNYLGLGYKMERYIGVSPKESLSSSVTLKFGLWFYIWDVYSVSNNANIDKDLRETKKIVFTEHNYPEDFVEKHITETDDIDRILLLISSGKYYGKKFACVQPVNLYFYDQNDKIIRAVGLDCGNNIINYMVDGVDTYFKLEENVMNILADIFDSYKALDNSEYIEIGYNYLIDETDKVTSSISKAWVSWRGTLNLDMELITSDKKKITVRGENIIQISYMLKDVISETTPNNVTLAIDLNTKKVLGMYD